MFGFGNKVKIKLKNDRNTLSIEDLPENIKDEFYVHMENHKYCPICGATRNLILLQAKPTGYSTKTGKPTNSYVAKASCPNSKHLPYFSIYACPSYANAPYWQRDYSYIDSADR
jgi:hypothetical protein